jgi:two-component system chemotaxis response regulator CheB
VNILSRLEKTILYSLIERIIGTNHGEMVRRNLFQSGIEAHLRTKNMTFNEFLNSIHKDERAFQEFVSLVTVHTTSWFRENGQFDLLGSFIEAKVQEGQNNFRVWSAACSTGQEVYSIGLIFERFKVKYPKLEYQILGTDIDVLCIEKAKRAVFPKAEMNLISDQFKSWLLVGEGRWSGYFTLTNSILDRCQFRVHNLMDSLKGESQFDLIFCRNVLIYFAPAKVRSVIQNLIENLKEQGGLFLAHAETLFEQFPELDSKGQSYYLKRKRKTTEVGAPAALVIDDVAVVRLAVKASLVKLGFVVFEAANADAATQILMERRIRIVTLDLNLPNKNGIVWLREVRSRGYNVPVVILSGKTQEEAASVFGAFESGAQEYIEKKELSINPKHFQRVVLALTNKEVLGAPESEFKGRSYIHRSKLFISPPQTDSLIETLIPELIVIGASTGGPSAIWELLSESCENTPPIVIVQHMNSFFAPHFARTLERVTKKKVAGIEPGVELQDNVIYMAHGDYHVEVDRSDSKLVLRHSNMDPEHGHRPSVDRLFESAARIKASCLAFLLTGMGQDGALGMEALFASGRSLNLVQSEQSCVVFGMPREAIERRCVHLVGDLSFLRDKLLKMNNKGMAKATRTG